MKVKQALNILKHMPQDKEIFIGYDYGHGSEQVDKIWMTRDGAVMLAPESTYQGIIRHELESNDEEEPTDTTEA